MTNWDALALASAIGKGTPVEFTGVGKSAADARAQARPKTGSKSKRR